jgi:hypothetical protein
MQRHFYRSVKCPKSAQLQGLIRNIRNTSRPDVVGRRVLYLLSAHSRRSRCHRGDDARNALPLRSQHKSSQILRSVLVRFTQMAPIFLTAPRTSIIDAGAMDRGEALGELLAWLNGAVALAVAIVAR